MQELKAYAGAKVVVTGGAGFVGSNMVKELVSLGAEVIVIDDLFTGDFKNIEKIKIKDFIRDDIRDIDLIKDVLLGQNFIFHLAARNIILSTTNPIEDFLVNIGGTLQILELLRKSKNLSRFVYTSSASIYGNHKRLPANEDDGINVLSPYAVSKLGGENYTKVFYEQFQLPVSIVRYSNVYGINQKANNPYCGVIGKFISQMAEKKSPIIHGNGEQTRDFTFVQDAVEATILTGVHPRANGEIFNVATGTETTINTLVKTIGNILHTNAPITYTTKRDIDNIRRRVMSIDKIKSLLNWEPSFTLEQGLTETIKWYNNQSNQ